MFIWSVRASTLKFFSAVIASLALLIVILGWMQPMSVTASGDAYTESVVFTGIRTEEDRVRFLAEQGYQVDPTPSAEESFVLPENFDRILLGYNELQKMQGLDLARYRKKRVTRYTYEVKNVEDADGKVYANLTVYKNRIVAADLCSADPDGFVRPLIIAKQ